MELLLDGDLEKQLVRSCRGGDKSAYAGLIRAYSGRVFAICFGMLGNGHDAEDVMQQAMLKGFTDIGRLRDSRQFGPWICRIAKNLCVDFIRRENVKQSALCERIVPSGRGSEEYSEVERALAKLPEKYRVVLVLYYFDSRSTEHIAETLQIGEAAVHTRMSRARKQLRRLLAGKGDER